MALTSLTKTGSIKTDTVSTVSAGFGPSTTNYGLTATGGTITEFTATNGFTYRAHTFNSTGSFVVTSLGSLYNNIELLVVGSGTGGFSSGGSGGQVTYYGAESSNYFSRVLSNAGTELTTIAVGTYVVTIGAGGATGTTPANPGTYTSASSSFVGPNISVTSIGGQIVMSSQYYTYSKSGNGFQTAGGGTTSVSAGGAGATGAGAIFNGTDYYAGPGGPGVYFAISGSPGFYGGGGSIGRNSGYGSNMARCRGEGGGFSGGRGDEAGVANTGGGGGSGWNGSGAKNGGSGVVIVKYRIR